METIQMRCVGVVSLAIVMWSSVVLAGQSTAPGQIKKQIEASLQAKYNGLVGTCPAVPTFDTDLLGDLNTVLSNYSVPHIAQTPVSLRAVLPAGADAAFIAGQPICQLPPGAADLLSIIKNILAPNGSLPGTFVREYYDHDNLGVDRFAECRYRDLSNDDYVVVSGSGIEFVHVMADSAMRNFRSRDLLVPLVVGYTPDQEAAEFCESVMTL